MVPTPAFIYLVATHSSPCTTCKHSAINGKYDLRSALALFKWHESFGRLDESSVAYVSRPWKCISMRELWLFTKISSCDESLSVWIGIHFQQNILKQGKSFGWNCSSKIHNRHEFEIYSKSEENKTENKNENHKGWWIKSRSMIAPGMIFVRYI